MVMAGQSRGYLQKDLLVQSIGVTLFTSMTKITKSVQNVILKKGIIIPNNVGVTTWSPNKSDPSRKSTSQFLTAAKLPPDTI